MGWKNYRTDYENEGKSIMGNKISAADYYSFWQKGIMIEYMEKNKMPEDHGVALWKNLAEAEWFRNNRKTIYVDDEVIKMLLHARYDAASIYDLIKTDKIGNVFSVVTNGNMELTSFLYAHIPSDIVNEYMLSSDKGLFATFSQRKDRRCGMTVMLDSKESFIECLNQKTIFNPDSIDINETEKNSLNLVIALNVYLTAFPDSIRPGFPDGMSNYEQKQQNTANAFRIGLPAKYHNSPVSHWRSGHFRRLLDERFKRDEQGRARIIYVNPCLVGEKVDPYTVEAR